MRILITNDDGINAEGIKYLVNWAKQYGEVTVFAPKVEQSGKGRSIEIHKGYECIQTNTFGDDIISYSVDSTPADCVRVAILGYKLKFDLVIAGINKGVNLGGDIMYSGTCGACFEGCHLGIKSIAFSADYTSFENAIKNIDRAYKYILDNKMLEYTDFVNVNFPYNGDEIKLTKVGPAIYGDDFVINKNIVIPVLICSYDGTTDLTIDSDAVMCEYISISPISRELTDLNAYDKLK